MAGKEDGAKQDNPFSFKSFVKRTSTDGGTREGGKREGRRKAKRSTADGAGVPFPEEGGENPFSFKKFVKKQTKTGASEDSTSGSSSSDDEHSFSISLEPHPTTISSTEHPLSLPTETNTTGAGVATASGRGGNKTSKKTSKTVTSSHKPQIHQATEGQKLSSKVKKGDNLFDESDSDSFTSTSHDMSLSFPTSGGGVASDPLGLLGEGVRGEGSEGVLRVSDDSSGDESLGIVRSRGQGSSLLTTADPSQTERLTQQCSQLTTENRQLKEELEKSKEKFRKEKQKNEQLKEQLQALKNKEAEETKVLEDMIAKVEENLVTSTKRAANAEATVSLLKQELKSLQVQFSQADAQSVHRHYEETLSGVRDKATYASRQLSMAAMAADQSIRELLSGVDTLKNVAEVLQFIDRISEIKQK